MGAINTRMAELPLPFLLGGREHYFVHRRDLAIDSSEVPLVLWKVWHVEEQVSKGGSECCGERDINFDMAFLVKPFRCPSPTLSPTKAAFCVLVIDTVARRVVSLCERSGFRHGRIKTRELSVQRLLLLCFLCSAFFGGNRSSPGHHDVKNNEHKLSESVRARFTPEEKYERRVSLSCLSLFVPRYFFFFHFLIVFSLLIWKQSG